MTELSETRIRSVLALHRPYHSYCVVDDSDRDVTRDGNNPDCPHLVSFCRECDRRWPCSTVQVLTTPIREEET